MGLFDFWKKTRKNNKSRKLLPSEIIFLNYLHKRNTNMEEIAGYWTYSDQIDFQDSSSKFMELELLRFTNAEESLSCLKNTELKAILKQNHQPMSGKKADLIKRICQNIVDYDQYVKGNYFFLTTSGQALVEENNYLIYFSKHNLQIFADEAYEMSRKLETKDSLAIALEILNARRAKHFSEKAYGSYRCDIRCLAEVFKTHNKEIESFEMILCVCHLDLSMYEEEEFNELAPFVVAGLSVHWNGDTDKLSISEFISIIRKNLEYVFHQNMKKTYLIISKELKKLAQWEENGV